MEKRTMMDTHIDALAFAAGVIPPAHLAVSHAPDVKRIPKRRIQRYLITLLVSLASGLHHLANWLERFNSEKNRIPKVCR